ncbi:Nuclear import receptor [Podila horticola]|nr:Nuclear import receptor [Podila horticola]
MATVDADTISQAVAAVHALYHAPGNSAKKEASQWLEGFQAKIVDDFQDLDAAHRASLRDSLLSLSMKHRASSKVIRTQLCLSVAGMALRMLEWDNPVAHMTNVFGGSTEDAAYLLEFLTVLPEEVNDNRNSTLTVGNMITMATSLGTTEMQ